MKAMILAAGRGARMGELTRTRPKPLIQAGGEPLIAHQIRALVQAGFSEIVINICYLARDIIEALGDGSPFGAHIQYSYETAIGRLETGGGVFQALPLLGEKPFLVTSADVWTGFPYQRLNKPFASLAHLVLVDNPDFHPVGDYALSAEGKVILSGKKYNYAGIAVLSPDLFHGWKAGCFGLKAVYEPALLAGQISGEYYSGAWFNVGTATELDLLNAYLANGQDL